MDFVIKITQLESPLFMEFIIFQYIMIKSNEIFSPAAGPLAKRTPHHIKNSIDFVNKITYLEGHSPCKLLFFNVSESVKYLAKLLDP